MTQASDIIDRRDRAHASVEELPTPGVWMETSLPWNLAFWRKLTPKSLMRLNPHWHIASMSDSKYPVEDVLVDKEFPVVPELIAEDNTFKATFPEIGLSISARSTQDGANTALSFNIDAPAGSEFDSEDAGRTMQYWLPSIREYYRLHESNSIKHRAWRFFMDKIMLTMNPTQRRICAFMFKLTVLECLLIIILGVGWFYYGA